MSHWRVEVHKGAPVDPEPGVAMEFGVPFVTVNGDGTTSEPRVNLAYDPVGLRVLQDHAWLWVRQEDGSSRNVRWMEHLSSVEIDWDGEMRLYGMEARADGALVTALWVVTPHTPTASELAAEAEILREAGFDVGEPPAAP